MAQIQVIRRRIKSVTNTRQITKAMELVAASKMRRAQEATFQSRPYSALISSVVSSLLSLDDAAQHRLFSIRPITNRLIIVVTSDRGLAGAYNSNTLKLFLENLPKDTSTKVIVIGQKGAQFVSRLSNIEILGTYINFPTQPTARDIYPIIRSAISMFEKQEIDSVELIYTRFISTIQQKANLMPLLPIPFLESEETKIAPIEAGLFEPSSQIVLEALLPRYLEAKLYQAVLESIASEQSMRMMAMKNATDNAEELINDLTLTYNGARQAAITQELAEITSGSAAII